MRSNSALLVLSLIIVSSALAADFAAGLAAYQQGDYVTAAKEWRALADQGDSSAQFNLGLLYYDGKGVPQDYAEAANWFRRAAEQDYEKAEHNLGAMYGSGKGVKKDYVQAYKWLNICAGKGDSGCVSQRDQIAKKLRPGQITQAQRLSTEFTPKKEGEQ